MGVSAYVTSTFVCLQEGDYLFRLKNIAFSTLSKLLCSGESKCGFMSQQDKTDLLK